MSQSPRGPHAARGPQLTRGPLPAAIYWRRRVVALVAALALVALVVVPIRLVTGGGDQDSAQVALSGTQERPVAEPTATGPAQTAAATGGQKKSTKQKKRSAPALPEPQGSCAPEDVLVRPRVSQAVAGRPVTVTLRLRTRLAEACTWELSRATFTWKLTSGSDEIWTSRECPRAVPSRELVVRRATVATTELTWGGRRSDADCSRLTEWALPGWYHVTVAALAGEPRSSQFELRAPAPATITASPEPEQRTGKKNQKTQKKKSRG